jgi:hypothetical protein
MSKSQKFDSIRTPIRAKERLSNNLEEEVDRFLELFQKLNTSFCDPAAHKQVRRGGQGNRVRIPDGTAAVSAANQGSSTKVGHWETGKAEPDRHR